MPPVLLGPIDHVGILGAGTAFPTPQRSNAEVLAGLSAEAWPRRLRADAQELAFVAQGLEETMGVRERAWAHLVGTPLDPGREPNTLDLAVGAGRAALEDAGLGPSDVGLVLCSTSTPHRMSSTVAAPLGAALGVRAACLDLRAGCSAGLFGLGTAALFQQAGQGAVLLVGTETFSKVVPPRSKLAALSLADGAGALVLGRKDGASLESLFYESDGSLGQLLSTDGALPPTQSEIDRGGYLLSGAPEEFVKVVAEKYLHAIGQALAHARLNVSDVDRYVPHQPGKQVIDWVCDKVGIPRDRAFVNVARHANVGAAGWLVALCEARAERPFRPGERILVASVGGGVSWGAAVIRCG